MLFCSSSFAQKQVIEFKLSKPENGIQINFLDTVFYAGETNPFEVISTKGEEIIRVEIFRGTIYKNPLGWYEASFNSGGPTMVKVYTRNSKGETYLAHSKSVTVIPLPRPKLFLCGVKADSALNIEHLIKCRTLMAEMPQRDKYFYEPIILSFEWVFDNDTIPIKGNTIPFEYKAKLYDLENGDVLTFLNINVQLPNVSKNKVTIPRFSVFLINTDQYSVGSRKYVNPSEE